MKSIFGVLLASLATAALSAMPIVARAGEIFVIVGDNNGASGEYDATTGAAINPFLVGNVSPGVPSAIAASGSDQFASAGITGTIGEYTNSGATVNASFITGLPPLNGNSLAVSGGDLFVANTDGTIGEYDATTGATVSASLVTGLNGPQGIAVSGGDLFVTNGNIGTVGEYTTSGALVDASLVTGLGFPAGIAVVPTPEPSAWVMLVIGGLALLVCGHRRQAV